MAASATRSPGGGQTASAEKARWMWSGGRRVRSCWRGSAADRVAQVVGRLLVEVPADQHRSEPLEAAGDCIHPREGIVDRDVAAIGLERSQLQVDLADKLIGISIDSVMGVVYRDRVLQRESAGSAAEALSVDRDSR